MQLCCVIRRCDSSPSPALHLVILLCNFFRWEVLQQQRKRRTFLWLMQEMVIVLFSSLPLPFTFFSFFFFARCVLLHPISSFSAGIGEHPTQALLDLFTIFEERKIQSILSESISSSLFPLLSLSQAVIIWPSRCSAILKMVWSCCIFVVSFHFLLGLFVPKLSFCFSACYILFLVLSGLFLMAGRTVRSLSVLLARFGVRRLNLVRPGRRIDLSEKQEEERKRGRKKIQRERTRKRAKSQTKFSITFVPVSSLPLLFCLQRLCVFLIPWCPSCSLKALRSSKARRLSQCCLQLMCFMSLACRKSVSRSVWRSCLITLSLLLPFCFRAFWDFECCLLCYFIRLSFFSPLLSMLRCMVDILSPVICSLALRMYLSCILFLVSMRSAQNLIQIPVQAISGRWNMACLSEWLYLLLCLAVCRRRLSERNCEKLEHLLRITVLLFRPWHTVFFARAFSDWFFFYFTLRKHQYERLIVRMRRIGWGRVLLFRFAIDATGHSLFSYCFHLFLFVFCCIVVWYAVICGCALPSFSFGLLFFPWLGLSRFFSCQVNSLFSFCLLSFSSFSLSSSFPVLSDFVFPLLLLISFFSFVFFAFLRSRCSSFLLLPFIHRPSSPVRLFSLFDFLSLSFCLTLLVQFSLLAAITKMTLIVHELFCKKV